MSEALRYEVYLDENSGGMVAVFRYIEDAREYAARFRGGIFDTDQQTNVTHYPLDPAKVGGHEVRPGWLRTRMTAGVRT